MWQAWLLARPSKVHAGLGYLGGSLRHGSQCMYLLSADGQLRAGHCTGVLEEGTDAGSLLIIKGIKLRPGIPCRILQLQQPCIV